MKRIPYGISNFMKLIQENYYYVDKTNFIEELENFNEQYIMFLRPRRFGKSLLTSVLDYYYNKAYKGEKLFDNLYIGKNPTPRRSSYLVLNFSFSGINTDTEEHTESGFNGNVAGGIRLFLSTAEIKAPFDYTKSAAEMMYNLFSMLPAIVKDKIYIIIDEYDHFANELLGFNLGFFKNSVSKNGFVRKFYEQIKEGTRSGIVDRIFITGVTSITLDSMTSGFNIVSNLTSEPMLNEMLGFTETEVRNFATEALGENIIINEHIEKLKSYYNGYMFHPEGKARLYNSDMILYYFNHFQRRNKAPEEMVDRNVVSDYGKIEAVFRLGGFDGERVDALNKLIKGENISVTVTDKFNIEHDFKTEDFKSLLFYMGFITIKATDQIGGLLMNVPNYVIKELYLDYFQALIERETAFTIDSSLVRDAIFEIAIEGKITKLICLTEDILHRLSNRDFIKFDEKYVKVILLNFLFKSKAYYTKSEYEVEDGYIDIVLLPGSVGSPNYYACFEIKYISKNDFTESLADQKLTEAKNQLTKYSSAAELRDLPNLKKFALVFNYDKCVRFEAL